VTLHIDRRAGSIELVGPLTAAGLRPEVTTLPAGDVEIMGSGPGGIPFPVLVEYKQVRDALTCARDGRFAEQLRGMRARAEVCWVLVEGEWRADTAGKLEVREARGWRERGGFTPQEFDSWLMTMAQRGGALLWRTPDQAASVSWLRSLYWWWTSKEFQEHRAHLAWYVPPYTPENPFDKAPSVVQKVAAALLAQGPTVDVNGERAKAVGAAFPSVRAMVDAGEAAWRAIEGIGPKIAKRVVEVLK
jgi:ERCC4-type nuclease